MNGVVKKRVLPFPALAILFMGTAAMAALTENYFLLPIPFAVLFFYACWQYPGFFYYLLLAAIPFSVEYNFTPNLGTDFPDELFMIGISFVLAGYLLYKPVGAGIGRHRLLLLLWVYLAWLLVTVLFSTNPLVSVKYLLAKSWYIGAFVVAPLLFCSNKKDIGRAAAILAGSVMLVTVIVLYNHSRTGFSFATASDAVQPFFRNHVNYSALLVCTLPLLWALRRLVTNRQTKNILAAAILVAGAALFFSYARGAWLALSLGVIAYVLIRKKWFFHTFLLAVLLVVSFCYWIKSNDRYLRLAHDYQTTIYHEDFSEHLVSTYRLKDLSTAERFYRWIAGVRMIKDNGLTGYGPNTFYENYKPYAVPVFKTWVSDNPERSTVHNYFLLLAIEQGIPGLLFFMILLGAMCWYVQHLYHRVQDPFYKTVALAIGIVLAMLAGLNSLSDLVETDKTGSIFYSCLALLIITDIHTRKQSDPAPDIERVP